MRLLLQLERTRGPLTVSTTALLFLSIMVGESAESSSGGVTFTGCSSMIDCKTCIDYSPSSSGSDSGDRCVWCESLGMCLSGSAETAGPFCPNDDLYVSACRAYDECFDHTDCFNCLSRPSGACGWCKSSGTCNVVTAGDTCEYGFVKERNICPGSLEQLATSCAACLKPLGEISMSFQGNPTPIVWCPASQNCQFLANSSSSDPDGCTDQYSGRSKRHYNECDETPSFNGACSSFSYTSCSQCTSGNEGCSWCFETSECLDYEYSCSSGSSSSNDRHCACEAIQSISDCAGGSNPFCTWCTSEGVCKYSPLVLGAAVLSQGASIDYQCKGNSYQNIDDDCSQHDECTRCADRSHCGWCELGEGQSVCLSGTIAGPQPSTLCALGVWSVSKHQCVKADNTGDCSQYKSGGQCTGQSNYVPTGCGWCGLSKQCFAGDTLGPFPPNSCPYTYWSFYTE